MTSPLVLDLNNIEVIYNNAVQVLRGLSLRVARGEIVALLGSNGAGKSSTVNAIAGILKPDRGKIRIGGKDISGAPSHVVIRHGVTLVPEGRRVFSQMTVMENLQLGGYSRSDSSQIAKALDFVFATFPRLAERKKQKAGLMSGGEQQMVAIARGLMSQPRLLILDEPSLGLMPTMVESVFELITTIAKTGISILLVEQNANQSLAIADRAYVLEKGSIVADGAARNRGASMTAQVRSCR